MRDEPTRQHLHDTAVVIMARAPVPGRCKTRLIPALGRRGAARLHERLAWASIRKALPVGTVILAAEPTTRHRFFVAWRARGLRVLRQQGHDLGQRMRAALRRALESHQAAIVMGTDCPSLTPADLRALATACASGSVACIPATDGGYVALAVNRDHPALFRQIAWGGARVLHQTRRAARLAGSPLIELTPRADLDTPTDYVLHRRRGQLPRLF